MASKNYKALSFRKCPWSQRKTYTYEFVDGSSITIHPGEDGSTENDIKTLHRIDDHEVYVNIKNSCPPVEHWQKEVIEEWIANHPDETVARTWNVSLDKMLDSDGGESNPSTGYLKAALYRSLENETNSTPVERMHELISNMKPRLQMVYKLAMLGKIPNTRVASILKVSEGTIRKDIKFIENTFREDTILKSFFH